MSPEPTYGPTTTWAPSNTFKPTISEVSTIGYAASEKKAHEFVKSTYKSFDFVFLPLSLGTNHITRACCFSPHRGAFGERRRGGKARRIDFRYDGPRRFCNFQPWTICHLDWFGSCFCDCVVLLRQQMDLNVLISSVVPILSICL